MSTASYENTSQEANYTVDLLNNLILANILGECDENLTMIEKGLGVRLSIKETKAFIYGDEKNASQAKNILEQLLMLAKGGLLITSSSVQYAMDIFSREANDTATLEQLAKTIYTTPRGKQIKAKTLGQSHYLNQIAGNDITFGVGPAGTGKTYLAVVMAVNALKKKEVSRIVLVRPAVEAGEKLGFLPGDLQEKVNPYLRPVYDALDDILGQEMAGKYIERNVIEVVPLAYMRGRTLDEAFIILDEAQNTTTQQMKMFLTRMGIGSKAVVTGDITQIDLPSGQTSGLKDAITILQNIKGISFCYLTQMDVVRHHLVQKIIEAYESQQSKISNT